MPRAHIRPTDFGPVIIPVERLALRGVSGRSAARPTNNQTVPICG